jgi:adenylosuccinate synthase
MISKDKKAYMIVDLGFGDAGKGTMTDWFAREEQAHTVIRFNGGSQAAHNVVAPDGRHHTFSQFGSATFVPGVRTHLSQFMIVNPAAMVREAEVLAGKGVPDAFARTTIHSQALVTTPFHIAANRLKEISRGAARHGSCGGGISEAAADALTLGDSVVRVGDLRDRDTLSRKLAFAQRNKRGQLDALIKNLGVHPQAKAEIRALESAEVIDSYMRRVEAFLAQANVVNSNAFLKQCDGNIIFEGAQGVLLDEWHGFHPYTTWSNCTFDNAYEINRECAFHLGEIVRVGVVRGYATRHGAGPFVTEDAELTRLIPDRHNVMDDWQRSFRVGWFDAVATRYAIRACHRIDKLVVTCMDRLLGEVGSHWQLCDAYRLDTKLPSEKRMAKELFAETGDALLFRDIKSGECRDLSLQEELTKMLGRVTPEYKPFAPTAFGGVRRATHEYLDLIGSSVGVMPSVASFGPSANDKRVL